MNIIRKILEINVCVRLFTVAENNFDAPKMQNHFGAIN